MTWRYIAVAGPDARGSDAAQRAARVSRLSPALLERDLIVLTDSADDVLLSPDARWCLYGTVFDRANRPFTSMLPIDLVNMIDVDDGQSICEHLWGGYLAIGFRHDGAIDLVRDPSGTIAAYWWTFGRHLVVTSVFDACVRVGLAARSVDWSGIVEHLGRPELKTSRTCISGVSELLPGQRLIWKDGMPEERSAWSPWPFASRQRAVLQRENAVELVRRSVRNSVTAWQHRFERPLLSLSGGLDSSIVAAALPSGAGAAITISTDDRSGDERKYARQVADTRNIRLLERSLDPNLVDVLRSHAQPLPRPAARLFSQGFDRLWIAAAAEVGASALFHGGGGDNVFCYLQSALPFIDALLQASSGARPWRTLSDVSRLNHVSVWAVLRASARKVLLDRGHYRWRADPRYLSREAQQALSPVLDHPWLRTRPATVLPGKEAHVASIVLIQNLLDAVEPSRVAPVVAPLMAQPVLEACLRVPTWMWCEDGVNRTVARHAFADRLPSTVVARRGKGSPGAFAAELVSRNRKIILDMLLEGTLAAHRVIDAAAIARDFAYDAPITGFAYSRLSTLVDVEAWLQATDMGR